MRPNAIVWFERLIFATLILGAIQSYLSWDQMISTASELVADPLEFIVFVQIFVFVLLITLTLLVSRRRSKLAMWVSIGLFALGLPAFIGLVASGLFVGLGFISIIQTIAQLVAYGLLFTPSSRSWLNQDDRPDQVFS